jgi:hypothetical protein
MNNIRFGNIIGWTWAVVFLLCIAFWSSVFYFIYKLVG